MTRALVVAVLALAACGKSERKGDCAKAVAHAMDVAKAQNAQDGVAESTQGKIRDASLARCREDKWANPVLVCFEDAKTVDDIDNCNARLTAEQRESVNKAIAAIVAADEPPTPTEPPADAGTATEEAEVVLPPGMPAECGDYKAMIMKLAACSKLPAEARDMLTKAFDESSKAWGDFAKMPEASKTALAETCKQGVETVKKAAGATCGL